MYQLTLKFLTFFVLGLSAAYAEVAEQSDSPAELPAKFIIKRVSEIELDAREVLDSISETTMLRVSLSLGGETFKNINVDCVGSLSASTASRGVPRAPGVGLISALVWFTGDGAAYASNPRIQNYLEKLKDFGSVSNDDRNEILQVYLCLNDGRSH